MMNLLVAFLIGLSVYGFTATPALGLVTFVVVALAVQ